MNCNGCEYDGFVMWGNKKVSYCKYFRQIKNKCSECWGGRHKVKKTNKQEAITILQSKMDGSIDTSYEWCEVIRMAIEALQDDWTPVSEKNPPQTGEYLVTVVCDNGATFTDKFGYTPTTDGGWYDPETPNQTYVDWNKHVIAWRPLPEPYNGDTRGEE